MNIEEIQAPRITAAQLWAMSPEDFNSWRRKNDYPRIISFLKEYVACFQEWMLEQKVTDEDLLEFAPAAFLKEVKELIIYELQDKNGDMVREIRDSLYSVGEVVFHEKTVLKRKTVTPYFEWAKSNKQCIESRVHTEFSINRRAGRKSYLFRRLELIDAGNVRLPPNFRLGGRELEFLVLLPISWRTPGRFSM